MSQEKRDIYHGSIEPLLHQAAKHEWPGGGCLVRRVVPEPEHPGSKWVPWRPLNDDHDALLFEAEELVALQGVVV